MVYFHKRQEFDALSLSQNFGCHGISLRLVGEPNPKHQIEIQKRHRAKLVTPKSFPVIMPHEYRGGRNITPMMLFYNIGVLKNANLVLWILGLDIDHISSISFQAQIFFLYVFLDPPPLPGVA